MDIDALRGESSLAETLFMKYIGETPESVTPLQGGQVGLVYKIDTNKNHSYVLKFNEIADEESVDDRVYGANAENFAPAYTMLAKHGIKLPELYTSGTHHGYAYHIMEYLDGSTIDNSLYNSDIFADTLGELHSIQREFQGWVMNTRAYTMSWRGAFSISMMSRLRDVTGLLDELTLSQINAFVDRALIKLQDPSAYVLSHLDGLQAVFSKDNNVWHLLGVIDIEDYQFTDQRFVLAGITLMQEFNTYKLGPNFWSRYKSHISIDSTFDEFETLFQMYYLLTWIKVHNDTGNTHELDRCINVIHKIIKTD